MVHIVKANGKREVFSERKLLHSIKRAGIPSNLQAQVIAHIQERLHENMTTGEIYRHILEFLEKSPQPYTKSRYSLKQAIMDLGPTGYPFENYIGKVLQMLGYSTKTRQILLGKCITHEIDVIAEKNTSTKTKIMVEAKFHNTSGMPTNVHVPLYTKSRFEDLKEKHGFTEVWVMTNTKATLDVIAYAGCVGMRIISWSYPEGESLRDLVEKLQLFPITAMTTISTAQKQQLLLFGIVLCKDICENQNLLDVLGLGEEKKHEVVKEAEFICTR